MFNTQLKKQLAECQQDFQDSQAKLSALDRSMAVIEFDTSGHVLTANANFLRLFGYELNEVIGKHHRLFLFEADSQSAAYQDFWQQLNAGKYISNRFKRKSKSGEIIWIEANYNPVLNKLGQVTKIVKFATDITERAKAESDAKGQLAAIYRSMAVIEFSLDGKILNANDNFLSFIGYTLSEIQGKHHQIFVKPDYAKQAEYQQFWNRLANGEYFSDTFERITKNGSSVWIEASYNPIFDQDGKPYKVVKYATDVTEQEEHKHDLARAVKDSADVLAGLAAGDLTKQMPSKVYKGALHDLKNAINFTLHNFKKLVVDVLSSVNIVRTSSTQVAQGAAELSDRMQQQAAALEQTSATMNEIASAVEVNTDHARRVYQLAKTAEVQTIEGTSVVHKTLDAMQSIAESSAKINDIVGVIDSIAFQTNLLALNAAVEAARAGEHGKGFAVVAGEVRALAQKSASAAKEISDLINVSNERVKNGQTLAEASGKTLSDVTHVIRQVSGMMTDMVQESETQASSIGQVHQAIAELDKVTQLNATLVENTSQAALNLSGEANRLDETMGIFRV